MSTKLKVTIYDPPEGWRYGFPKIYKPIAGESLIRTLARDGYPEEMILYATYTRFWQKEVEDEGDNP